MKIFHTLLLTWIAILSGSLRPVRLFFLVVPILVLSGCATSPTIPMAKPKQMDNRDWVGTWVGTSKGYYGYDSTVAIVINSNGSGEAVDSTLFPPRIMDNKWVASNSFTWRPISANQLEINLQGPRTLAGKGVYGIWAKSKGVVPLYSTQTGLRMDALSFKNSTFARSNSQPDAAISQRIAAEVTQRALALKAEIPSAPSGNQTAGLFLAGAGLGAAAGGNLPAAQQLMNQAASTYSGVPYRDVNQIGSYDRNKYFVGGKGKAKESMGQPTGSDAQLREAYPDGQAWDVQALNGTIWKVYYGAPTSIKDQMIAGGNLVRPSGFDGRNKVLRGPYKPYSGMKIGVVAINPP